MSHLAELSILKAKVIPDRVAALFQGWCSANFGNGTGRGPTPSLWRGLLSPEAMASMRSMQTNKTAHSHQAIREHPASRLLTAHPTGVNVKDFKFEISEKVEGYPFKNPELTKTQLSVSIVSTILTTATEILFHVEFFARSAAFYYKFYMPWWGWLLMTVPTQAFAVSTCSFGLSKYCWYEIGVIGVHQLEALIGIVYKFR